MPSPSAIIAGLCAAVLLAFAVFYEFVRIPREREAARSAVLLEVKDQQLRAQAKAEQDRRAAQDKIARIEADYFNRQAADAVQIQALNEAIANVENTPSGPCSCGLPVELRNAVNGFGREAGTGGNPTVSAPAVRPAGRASKRSLIERHSGPTVGK